MRIFVSALQFVVIFDHTSDQKDYVVNMNILLIATNMIEKINYGILIS